RSEAQEEHWIRFATLPPTERGQLFATVGPVVAVNNQGEVQGYLRQGWGPLRSFGCEVAAASAEAVLSLAAYHSGLRGPLLGRDEVVSWQLPPASLTAEWLGDFVPVAVCSAHQPAEGWMAAVTEKTTLVDGLARSWCGADAANAGFSLRVGDVQRAVGRVPPGATEVSLDEHTLVQLLFGYRKPSWARSQTSCVVPCGPAVEHFLTNEPWIPPSNGW
ncbi:MAG TPA: hypothetical protein VEJ84_04725, partial [Acidimicrobiales bacterium]|nr:hypothetical protein [Acidimicrobiales bacterium]